MRSLSPSTQARIRAVSGDAFPITIALASSALAVVRSRLAVVRNGAVMAKAVGIIDQVEALMYGVHALHKMIKIVIRYQREVHVKFEAPRNPRNRGA